MRQLASIQKIVDLIPIEGADQIVLARVLGWTVIVRKDEYKVGDLCVYVEIDSILPEKPEFEFLRSKKFRIKTMKMRGVISQGICFPLSILPSGDVREGLDVTDIIGVKKYEDEEPRLEIRRPNIFGKKNKDFPSWIKKTDETRIQNFPNFGRVYNDLYWECTEKLDGTSATYAVRKKGFFGKKEFVACSRNLTIDLKDDNFYNAIIDKYNIEIAILIEMKRFKSKSMIIQGEIVGPKIQKNKYKLFDIDFFIFNIIRDGKKYNWTEIDSFCKNYGLKPVPFLYNVRPKTVDEAVMLASGKSRLNEKVEREGIVMRLVENPEVSFKVINPDFLIKFNE